MEGENKIGYFEQVITSCENIDLALPLSIVLFLSLPISILFVNSWKLIKLKRSSSNLRLDCLECLFDARRRFESLNIHTEEYTEIDEQGLLILPSSSTTNFCHQVAGHTNEVLRRYKNLILKPRVKPNLFLRELSLYEHMMESDQITDKECVNEFLPKYFGCVVARVESNECLPFLCLEDLTRGYKYPCIMDVKMGRQTFEPNASRDKQCREKIKYCYQEEIGFRITGFKVLDVTSMTYSGVDKLFGRSLTPLNVQYGLASFFYDGKAFRKDVIRDIVTRLKRLLTWMRKQNTFHFYCSSILMIYDGNDTIPTTDNIDDNHTEQNNRSSETTSETSSFDFQIVPPSHNFNNNNEELDILNHPNLKFMQEFGTVYSSLENHSLHIHDNNHNSNNNNSSNNKSRHFIYRSVSNECIHSHQYLNSSSSSPPHLASRPSQTAMSTISSFSSSNGNLSECLLQKRGRGRLEESARLTRLSSSISSSSKSVVTDVIATDNTQHNNHNETDTDDNDKSNDKVICKTHLKMIDLAHTVPSVTGDCDFGYIHGLEMLIKYLEGVLVEKNEEEFIEKMLGLFANF